jgi:cell division protein FtsB
MPVLRVIAGGLLALLLGLQLSWWLGKGGVRDARQLAEQIAEQERQLEALRVRNGKLAAEVRDLKQGLDSIEELARSEMGMIREGEVFHQMIDAAPATALSGVPADGRATTAPTRP